MMRWSRTRSFSKTLPKTSPPVMASPSRKFMGRKRHCFVASRQGTSMPLGTYTDCVMSAMSASGRWMPSKMVPMMPGPSSTDSGLRVRSTGSPTVSPDVSSYTWMEAVSASSLMISPTSFE